MADTVSALFDILFTQHKYQEAKEVFDRVVRASSPSKPNKTLVSICGNYLARTGQWPEACDYFKRLIELDPGNHQAYQALASLYIQTADTASYAGLCQQMMALFGSVTNDPRIADRIAKSCLIIPPEGEMLPRVAALANVSVSYDAASADQPWFQFCKGFAELRLHNYGAAKKWMLRVAEHQHEGSIRDVEARLVLALAEHGLNNSTAALAAYDEATELASRRLRDVSSGDIESGWADWVIGHSLMREAKQALFPPPPAP